MAPEPLHLAGIVKYCHRCGSTDVKYMYDNNGKRDQPRYKCLNKKCCAFFTNGGKCRGPYDCKRPGAPVERPLSNQIRVVAGDHSSQIAKMRVAGDRSSRIAKPGVVGYRSSARIAKPNRGALSRGVRCRLRIFHKSKLFEVENILEEDLVGVVGSAAIRAVRSCNSSASSVNSNCISSASSANSELFPELLKSGDGSSVGATWSSTGAVIVDQHKASKAVHEGEESKVEWVKAILEIAPPGPISVQERKQLKRIRVKHQEWESIIEYCT